MIRLLPIILSLIFGLNLEAETISCKDIKQLKTNFKRCLAIAKTGNADVQYRIATAYFKGIGVGQNAKSGEKWLVTAAEAGHVEAIGELASIFLTGEFGIEPNPKLAAKWYQKAADKNSVEALYILGYLYSKGIGIDKNPATALKWYRKSAELGFAKGQNRIGMSYMQGGFLLKKEIKVGLSWLEKAAEQNFVSAQGNLCMYFYDNNAQRNAIQDSVRWCTKAAENNDAASQRILATMSYAGKVVTKDLIQAFKWLFIAAANGDNEASKEMDLLMSDMTDAQIMSGKDLTKKWLEAKHGPLSTEKDKTNITSKNKVSR